MRNPGTSDASVDQLADGVKPIKIRSFTQRKLGVFRLATTSLARVYVG